MMCWVIKVDVALQCLRSLVISEAGQQSYFIRIRDLRGAPVSHFEDFVYFIPSTCPIERFFSYWALVIGMNTYVLLRGSYHHGAIRNDTAFRFWLRVRR